MIYKLSIKNSLGKQKEFFLTEDSQNKAVRRACSTYCVPKDSITVLAEYEELEGYTYKLKNEFVKKKSKKEEQLDKKASELYHTARGLNEPSKSEYRDRCKFTEFTIETESDIIELLNKYKKVKVYWESTEKRGVHKYYALVK